MCYIAVNYTFAFFTIGAFAPLIGHQQGRQTCENPASIVPRFFFENVMSHSGYRISVKYIINMRLNESQDVSQIYFACCPVVTDN